MKTIIIIVALLVTSLGLATCPYAGEVTLGPDLKIPPHYKPGGGGCSPGRGYSFSAEAPNYASTYPKVNLRVFNGEVIGFTFEVPAKEGWKPWYDQPEGMAASRTTRRRSISKKGPTAEGCKSSKGPYGR